MIAACLLRLGGEWENPQARKGNRIYSRFAQPQTDCRRVVYGEPKQKRGSVLLEGKESFSIFCFFFSAFVLGCRSFAAGRQRGPIPLVGGNPGVKRKSCDTNKSWARCQL